MKRSGFSQPTYEEKLEKAKTAQIRRQKVKMIESTTKRVKTPQIGKSKAKRVKKVTVTQLKKKLWEECKRIVRKTYISDDGLYRCFTCGMVSDAIHTGHIVTSSLCSMEMRYSLDNLRLQCYACNIHKSGNWVEFKKRLGDDYINDLIKRNDETKGGSYGMSWVENKLAEYRLL